MVLPAVDIVEIGNERLRRRVNPIRRSNVNCPIAEPKGPALIHFKAKNGLCL